MLAQLLVEVVVEVRAKNVVQVITNNATTHVAEGRTSEERFPTLVWTPCVAHCLDLLLEDIGKLTWVVEIA